MYAICHNIFVLGFGHLQTRTVYWFAFRTTKSQADARSNPARDKCHEALTDVWARCFVRL